MGRCLWRKSCWTEGRREREAPRPASSFLIQLNPVHAFGFKLLNCSSYDLSPIIRIAAVLFSDQANCILRVCRFGRFESSSLTLTCKMLFVVRQHAGCMKLHRLHLFLCSLKQLPRAPETPRSILEPPPTCAG